MPAMCQAIYRPWRSRGIQDVFPALTGSTRAPLPQWIRPFRNLMQGKYFPFMYNSK